eukprot:gene68-98_t
MSVVRSRAGADLSNATEAVKRASIKKDSTPLAFMFYKDGEIEEVRKRVPRYIFHMHEGLVGRRTTRNNTQFTHRLVLACGFYQINDLEEASEVWSKSAKLIIHKCDGPKCKYNIKVKPGDGHDTYTLRFEGVKVQEDDSILVHENDVDKIIGVSYTTAPLQKPNIREFTLSDNPQTLDGSAASRNFGWDDIRTTFLSRTRLFINAKWKKKANSQMRLKLMKAVDEVERASTMEDTERNIKKFVNSVWFKDNAVADSDYWLMIADNIYPKEGVTTAELAKQARHAVYFKFKPGWNLPYDGPIKPILEDPFARFPEDVLTKILGMAGMSGSRTGMRGTGIPRFDLLINDDCYNDRGILRYIFFDSTTYG